MLPIIATRPNAPNTWPFSSAPGITMARHHVLPYNVLRDAWNNLVNAYVTTQAAEARMAVRRFITLGSGRFPRIDDTLEGLKANRLTVVECNELQENAVWAAWNIVDGPKDRSDDPRDTYLDRFTFGITLAEFKRMSVIERLYRALEQFNGVVPAPVASLGLLAEALELARLELGRVELPIPYRDGMWERDPDGRWRKRRSGDQFIAG